MLFLQIVLGVVTIIGLAFLMRANFRDNLKPFQVVGVMFKGEVSNFTIVSVNREMRTISVLHNKEAVDVSFDNVYMPTLTI